ncbi:MAG: hypothetical protein U9O94_01480 [Nanoarchaeota archaeon]|nr:hypothetical protein [Nanoarchaeota archaeon]
MTLINGAQLKYGMIKNESSAPVIEISMGAEEVIAQASGRFVVDDGSSRMEMAADGSTLLAGWVELPEGKYYSSTGIYTCSATEGADKAPFTPISACLGVVFRIPVDSGTYTANMKNNTCDLAVSSNIQGVQLDASAEDTLIVVDGDLVNNAWVDVMVNPAKITGFTGANA